MTDPLKRSNHYGSQPMTSVQGLTAALEKKQPTDPKLQAIAEAPMIHGAEKQVMALVAEDRAVPLKVGGFGPTDILDRQTAEQLFQPSGASGSSGSGTTVSGLQIVAATRSALSNVTPSLGATRFLLESGREGVFQYQAGNLSTFVSADPNQGIYVAPATNPTGSSGAWVRQFKGAAESTWWGVSTSGTAAANTAAYNAALATLKALALTGYGYNKGSIPLHTPAGHYFQSGALIATHALEQFGDTVGGMGSMAATVFEWTSATTQGFDCPGWNGTDNRASGGSVHGFYLLGAYAGTEGEYHAIRHTAKMDIYDIYGQRWPGDCVNGNGQFSSNQGNINSSTWRNVAAQECRWTVQIGNLLNDDCNGCFGTNIGAIANRRGNIADLSFLGGNVWVGGTIEPCSPISAHKSRCHSGGHIYTVAFGQEAFCAANAPTGTLASNTGWLYLEEGSASAVQPNWSGGQTWYFAAPIVAAPTNPNQQSVFIGHHIEAGQNPTVLSAKSRFDPAFCFNGASKCWTAAGLPHGGYFIGDGTYAIFQNNLRALGGLSALGQQHFLGSTTTTLDTAVYLDNNASISEIIGRTGGVEKAKVRFYSGFGLILESFNTTRFDITGTGSIATLTAGGFDLASGKVLSNNGVTLINGSGVIQAAAMPAHTGDVTSPAGSLALTIANNAVTYAKMQDVSATARLIGRMTAGSGDPEEIPVAGGLGFTAGTNLTINGAITAATSVAIAGAITSSSGTAGIGYATGAGGAVTQATSRTTGVTINKVCGQITLVSAAGSATYQSFTVTNSTVAATDTIRVCQASGTDLYEIHVTAVAAGSFRITFRTTGGTTTEQPVFNFAVMKGVAA